MLKEAQELEVDLLQVLKDNQFESTIDQTKQNLIQELFNFQNMKVAMSELGCDIDKLPIGKLTNDKIKRAHQILTEIQRLLVSEDEKEQKKHQLIVQLTNDFYNVIPHNFGMKKPPVIDHLLRVKEKTRMVEQLQDIIELQSIYINALGFDLKNKAAADVFYDSLCVKMEKLDHDSDVFAVLYKAIENT